MDMPTGSLESPAAPTQEVGDAEYVAEAASLALATLVRLTAHAGAALSCYSHPYLPLYLKHL